MTRAIAAMAALALAGCGAMVDLGYRLGDGRYTESAEESAPTAETVTRTEYQAALQPDQSLHLECATRTRQVERRWSVTKTFEYRGGYSRGTYLGTAILDGVLGAVIAGSLLGICTHEDSDTSCLHMLWASPFAIDLLYSVIRNRTVRDPVLVDKNRSGDQMRYADTPLEEQATACAAVTLWLGRANGPSAEDLLNGRGNGETRALDDDALSLPLEADGAIELTPEAAAYWAARSYADLWVRDAEGGLHPVQVDRCPVLRPHAARLTAEARQTFDRDCPLPQPPQQ